MNHRYYLLKLTLYYLLQGYCIKPRICGYTYSILGIQMKLARNMWYKNSLCDCPVFIKVDLDY